MLRILSACLSLATPLFMQAQLDVPWEPLGGGTNQQVQALLRLSNGNLLMAGQFNFAGTTPCTRVARWDGSTYTAMPGFPEHFEIYCAAELNDTIYVGGRSTGELLNNELMKWDGNTWSGQELGGNVPGITALFAHDGILYASDRFIGIVGGGAMVWRLNSTMWELVGQPLSNEVHCIGHFNGQLVCGGSFTATSNSAANNIRHIAYLDNNTHTWTQLGDGLNGTVYDLLLDDEVLYATGDMRSPTASYFGLARITPEDNVWEPLMPNIGDYVRTPVSGMMAGRAMVERNGEIYIGGEFLIGDATAQGRGIAVFHGEPDEVEAFGHFEGPVQAVELFNDHELVIGGRSNVYRHIASTDLLTTGITSMAEPSFTLSPNPSSGRATIQLAGTLVNWIHISDINGRLVREVRTSQWQDVLIDLSGEPQGTYIIEVGSEGTVQRERLILMH